MKTYIPVLEKTRIFAGVSEEDIFSMLSCLDARLCIYKKGAYVLRQGERISDLMVLVDGTLHIQRDDYWGNRSILEQIAAGEMFGEAYLSPESDVLLNDVIAVENSAVMLFNGKKLLTTCPSACRFHSRIVQNIFFAVSEKNRKLVQKLGHMSRRSTREKLLSYLSEEAVRQGSPRFSIPFNRQQLADFLSVDRSAMSNELGKLRDAGFLKFDKNYFELVKESRA